MIDIIINPCSYLSEAKFLNGLPEVDFKIRDRIK